MSKYIDYGIGFTYYEGDDCYLRAPANEPTEKDFGTLAAPVSAIDSEITKYKEKIA